MSTFETRDRSRLYYKDWGKGEAVLFIHGFALNADCWDYQMPYLVEHGMRCIAFDRRGCGRSDQPSEGYDLDTLADDIAALIAHLDLHRVTLVGHSMACAEITRYLSRHGKERIARCVLVAPTTPFLLYADDNPEGIDADLMENQLGAMLEDRARYFTELAPAFFGTTAEDSTWQETIRWGVNACLQSGHIGLIQMLQLNFKSDVRREMHVFDMPTLIVQGGRDSNPPEITGLRTAAMIPGSRLRFYPDAPHGLIYTHKHMLNDDLLAFISDDQPVKAAA
jgi:non-heme chloroperoxidase